MFQVTRVVSAVFNCLWANKLSKLRRSVSLIYFAKKHFRKFGLKNKLRESKSELDHSKEIMFFLFFLIHLPLNQWPFMFHLHNFFNDKFCKTFRQQMCKSFYLDTKKECTRLIFNFLFWDNTEHFYRNEILCTYIWKGASGLQSSGVSGECLKGRNIWKSMKIWIFNTFLIRLDQTTSCHSTQSWRTLRTTTLLYSGPASSRTPLRRGSTWGGSQRTTSTSSPTPSSTSSTSSTSPCGRTPSTPLAFPSPPSLSSPFSSWGWISGEKIKKI